VGAVLVLAGNIAATGYNGAPKGLPHCDLHGCDLDLGGHCVNAVHAEINTIVQTTLRPQGGTLYVTTLPCRRCFGALVNAGVTRIVYASDYSDPTHLDSPSEHAAWATQAAVNVGISLEASSPCTP